MSKIKDTFFGGAEKRAGRKQAEALQRGEQLVSEAFGTTEQQISPFLERQVTPEAGLSLQKQQALSGALGPGEQATAFEQFQESPGVSFLREEGLRGIESGAGATGGLGGGDRLRELTKFSQGLALQDLQNQFGRLSVTGAGEERVAGREAQEVARQQGAAFGLGGLRGQAAGQRADITAGRGAATASGILGQAAQVRAFEEQQSGRAEKAVDFFGSFFGGGGGGLGG